MLGALEVKAISRFAAQHRAEWKPVHTAVLQGLLAHRNRRTGRCFPERRVLAANCNVSERTIDRILDQLTAWGAIERQQPRAVSSQQFREAQYTFLFELPQSAENAVDSQGKSCADQPSRASNSGGAVRQNSAEPCVRIEGAVRQNRGPNKEEGKDHEVKDPTQRERGEAPPPPQPQNENDEIFQVVASPELQKMHDEFWAEMDEEESKPRYTQQDFDERDWRKLNHQISMMREASVGNPGGGGSGEERFKQACQRAGISPRRGYELWERMMA
jgi:hypothetical protein